MNASLVIKKGDANTAILTIKIGSKKRVPNTANKIPQVRKRFCHSALIFFRTLAFTTALSKESVTSSIERITTKKSAEIPMSYHTHAKRDREITTGNKK